CQTSALKMRLLRARSLLKSRLTRPGSVLSEAALVAVLSEQVASAVVPATLATSTVQTAILIAGGKATAGTVGTPAGALAEATLGAMTPSRLKLAAWAMLLVLLVGGMAIGIAHFSARPNVRQVAEQQNSPLPTWRLEHSIPVANLYDLCLSPDGRTCVSTSDDHTVRLWDTATGQQKAILPVQGTFARFSPDGRWIALSDLKANKAHIVETVSTKVTCSLPPEFAALFAAPAPALVVFDSFASNGQAKVYDSVSGRLLSSYRLPTELTFWS